MMSENSTQLCANCMTRLTDFFFIFQNDADLHAVCAVNNTECYALKSNQEVHREPIFFTTYFGVPTKPWFTSDQGNSADCSRADMVAVCHREIAPEASLTVGHLIALLTPTTIVAWVISIDVLHKLDIGYPCLSNRYPGLIIWYWITHLSSSINQCHIMPSVH